MVTFFKAREKKSVSNIRPVKLRLIGALVWPVPTYDSEAWTLKKQEENVFKHLKTNASER